MKKSKISSNEEPVDTLMNFLDGKLALDNLLDQLSDYMIVEFPLTGGTRKIIKNDLEGVISLEFKPHHLVNMVKRYLEGRISAKTLSDWSAFIFLSGLFIPEGATEEERWEAGDGPVWDILQQLVSPSVFGGLNALKAEEYLRILGE
jgi:hypothetical protein